MQTNDTTATPEQQYTATLRYDPGSHFYWLEFDGRADGRADDATIADLKRAGWRWSGYRQQWRNNRRNAPFLIPARVTISGEGTCDYASERADRLEDRAAKHHQQYEAKYNRAHALASVIPMGQPVLIGHHSQRRDENYRNRIHNTYGKAFEELKESERLNGAAESSRRHQAFKETTPAMVRRAERLRAEERQLDRIITGLDKRAERGENVTTYRQQCDWRIGKVREELAELDAKIAAAGGLLADRVEVHVGDLIRLSGHLVRVTRVNPKTFSGTIHAPENRNLHGWKINSDRSKFSGIVRRADDKAGDTESEPTLAEVMTEQHQQPTGK